MGGGSVIFGAFLGVAVVYGLTACVLLPIMRRRFLVWIFARTLMFAGMAVALFLPGFDAALFDGLGRQRVAEVALAMSVAFSGPLLASYIEPELEIPRLRRVLDAVVLIGTLAAFATVLSVHWPWLGAAHDFLLLVSALIVARSLWLAIEAGSRIARFQAAAWAPLIGVGLFALSFELLAGRDMAYWPQAVLAALVIDFVGTTSGIVDSFMLVVRQRDEAFEDVRAARIAVATDPLTGIANRRGLALRFRDPQVSRPTALAVFDCDHFKRINDQYGHDVGDEVLMAIARGLQGEDIFAARQGGEEFVILLYTADWQRRAEAVRRMLTIAVLEAVPEVAYPVTASAGLTPVTEDDTLDTATKRADKALYAAKDMGRDRTVLASEDGRLGPRLVVAG